jgi:hypothetical protein
MTTDQIIARLQVLARRLSSDNLERYILKAQLERRGVRKYKNITVYKVKEAEIPGHTRVGYTATRVNL